MLSKIQFLLDEQPLKKLIEVSPYLLRPTNGFNSFNQNDNDRRPISTNNPGFNINNGNFGFIPSGRPQTPNQGNPYQPTSTSNSPTAFIVGQQANEATISFDTVRKIVPLFCT